MSTQLRFIDQTGLAKVFELIAGKYETIANFQALTALVGAAAKGDEEAKTILERIAALEGLAGDDSVADQIADAIDALEGSATSTDGELVNITVTSADGEVATASVDETGLASKISDLEDADQALSDLVGFTPEEGEGKPQTVKAYIDAEVATAKGDASDVATDLADEVTRATEAEEELSDRLDVIEGEGEGSIAKAQADATSDANDYTDEQIGVWSVPASEGVEAVAGSGLRAEIETKIAAVNSDASALEARVKANEDALGVINSTDATKVGSLAKNLADAKAYTDEAEARLLGSDELAESLNSIKDIVDYITASDDKEGVTNLFEMVTANGQAITAEETARKAQIGELGKVSEEEGAADHTVKSYVDAAIADANKDAQDAVDGLNADFSGDKAVSDTEGFVTVGIKEEKGVITTVTVATNDIASAQDLADEIERAEGAEGDLQDAIDALDEKVGFTPEEGEGKPQTLVAYIDKAIEDAQGETSDLADLVGELPEDTEAETVVGYVDEQVQAEADRIDGIIGAWSVEASEGVEPVAGSGLRAEIEEKISAINGAAETLEGRVSDLEDAVDLLNGTDEEEGSVAFAVKAEADRIDAIVGTPDTNKTIQDEIDDVEAYLVGLQLADGSAATTVQAAIDSAVSSAGHLKRSVVDALPTENIDVDTIYMVVADPVDGTDTGNVYAEYMYINSKWERIGSTAVNLAEYQKTSDLVALTNDEIAKLFNPSTPTA